MQNYLPACKIVSTHGVRGEMKALPLCDGAAAFLAKFKRLFSKCGRRRGDPRAGRACAGQRDFAAAGRRWRYGRRPRTGGPGVLSGQGRRPPPKGRYFIDDLLGCDVVDAETGRVYGQLTNVDRPPRRTSIP